MPEDSILLSIIGTILTILGVLFQRQLVKIKEKITAEHDEKKKAVEGENLGFSMLCDKVVMDIVAENRVRFDASRAYVIRFHNGSFFTANQPVWRMTCTHESCARGVSYETLNIQGSPASSVIDVIIPFWGRNSKGVRRVDTVLDEEGDVVDSRKGVYIATVDELEDNVTKQVLDNQNIKKLIITPLLDITSGKVIGLFGIDYVYDVETLPVDIRKFREAATSIAYMFSRENKCDGAVEHKE